MIAVGSVAINHTPLPVKVWATSTFGTNDKTVLLLGVFVVVFLYAMVVGVLAARRLAYGFAGLALFAVIGIAAAVTRHGASRRVRAADGVRRAGRGVRAVPAHRGRAGDDRGDRGARAAGGAGAASGTELPPIVFGEPSAGSPDRGRCRAALTPRTSCGRPTCRAARAGPGAGPVPVVAGADRRAAARPGRPRTGPGGPRDRRAPAGARSC